MPVAIGRRSCPNPHLGKAGELALVEPVQESGQTDQLSYYPGQDQGFELSQPNIYPVPEFLECVNQPYAVESNLQDPLTEVNNRIYERSPVRIQY